MTKTKFGVLLALATFLLPAVAQADWAEYRSEKFGFSMKVPTGTNLADKDFGNGWGGLYANSGGVEVFAVAKLGTEATAEEIEAFGVRVSGVPAGAWKKIDGGSTRGWKFFKTYEATNGNKLAFCKLGTGPKGSYIIFMVTTISDYQSHKGDYHTWYKSLTLF